MADAGLGAAILPFANVMANLLSGDNPTRRQAEGQYESYRVASPDSCIQLLLMTLSGGFDDGIMHIDQELPRDARQMAGVCLRKALGKSEYTSLWANLQPSTHEYVKFQLLAVVQHMANMEHQLTQAAAAGDEEARVKKEEMKLLRQKTADCISDLAILILDPDSKFPGTWATLLPFVFQMVESPFPGLRQSGFSVIRMLSAYLGDQLVEHAEQVRMILYKGLVDQESLEVTVAALEASANFLQCLSDPHDRLQFQELNPTMLAVVGNCLNNNDEHSAREALELFVEFAEIDPVFLKPHLEMFVNAMIAIACSEHLEDQTVQLGVEFLVTLAESKPGMCRRMVGFVESILPVVLRMMLQIEDDETWYEGIEEEEVQDHAPNNEVGEEALDRVAIALGGSTIVPQLFAVVPTLLGTDDWRYRHTALMGIAIVGEGSKKFMEPFLMEIVKQLSPYFQDAHPRVRWAACNSFGQLCTDFGPKFQKTCHRYLVPNLCQIMENDTQIPRVQSHAAAACINFCDGADADLVTSYLPSLLGNLVAMMQSPYPMAQEHSVTAVAAIADCVEEKFAPYYHTFVPHLKAMLRWSADQPKLRQLRGKMMECVTLIGVAVGVEKFRDDAREVMEILLSTQQGEMSSDDPQLRFILQAWARICRCLKQEFVPFLSYVMPYIMKSASLAPEISITDIAPTGTVSTSTTTLIPDLGLNGVVQVTEENAQPGTLETRNGWDYMVVGDKRISVHTSSMEEKATACMMLVNFAGELQEGFYNYVDEVSRLMVPLMKFYFHDGVRLASWKIMPPLMQSVRMHYETTGQDSRSQFFRFVFSQFLEAVSDEAGGDTDELDSLEWAAESLAQFVACTGPGVIDETSVAHAFSLAIAVRQLVMARRQERHERIAQDEDHDEEAQEALEAEDDSDADVLLQIGELVGQLAKHAPAAFLKGYNAYPQELHHAIWEMSGSSVPRDRHFALCVFDDMLEHLTERFTLPFSLPDLLPLYYTGCQDPHHAVRQAAVFGLGLACQYAGHLIPNEVPKILQVYIGIINAPGSREDEGVAMCTENAISGVAKIAMHQAQNCGVDLASLLSLWLTWLPCMADEVEGKVIYAQFCTFLEDPNYFAVLMAEPNAEKNMSKIFSVIGYAYSTNFTDENVDRRMRANFLNLYQQYGQKYAAAIAEIPADVQQQLLYDNGGDDE